MKLPIRTFHRYQRFSDTSAWLRIRAVAAALISPTRCEDPDPDWQPV